MALVFLCCILTLIFQMMSNDLILHELVLLIRQNAADSSVSIFFILWQCLGVNLSASLFCPYYFMKMSRKWKNKNVNIIKTEIA